MRAAINPSTKKKESLARIEIFRSDLKEIRKIAAENGIMISQALHKKIKG